MKYYAALKGNELVQVGASSLPEHINIELTIEQAKSLLSGQTSWRDWALVDGALRAKERVDSRIPWFANMLERGRSNTTHVTEKDNPLALYVTIKGTPEDQQSVSFWHKKNA